MDNNAKIATCNICLLSTLKDCKKCAYNPGNMKLTPEETKTVTHTELLKDGAK